MGGGEGLNRERVFIERGTKAKLQADFLVNYFIHTTALLFDSIHFYVPVSLSAV